MRKLTTKQLVELVATFNGNTPGMRTILGDKLITCPACGMKYVEGTVHPGYDCPACNGSWERAQWLERSVKSLIEKLPTNWAGLTFDELAELHQAFFETYYGFELARWVKSYEKWLKEQNNA